MSLSQLKVLSSQCPCKKVARNSCIGFLPQLT